MQNIDRPIIPLQFDVKDTAAGVRVHGKAPSFTPQITYAKTNGAEVKLNAKPQRGVTTMSV